MIRGNCRKLKDRRAVLQDECQQLHRTRKKELDVEMKRNQIAHLETRLKNTRMELNKIKHQELVKFKQELEALNCELSLFQVSGSICRLLLPTALPVFALISITVS